MPVHPRRWLLVSEDVEATAAYEVLRDVLADLQPLRLVLGPVIQSSACGLELGLGLMGGGGVAHFAHLGGMVGGFLMIRYWRGQPPFGRR